MGQKVHPNGIRLELIELGHQDGFLNLITQNSASRFRD